MRAPIVLEELQAWMSEILLRPLREVGEYKIPILKDPEIERRVSPGPVLTAHQRIGLYNQQYWYRILNIMQDHFPGLVLLFGHGDFNRKIAEPYVLEHSPVHWSLSRLGEHMSLWLKRRYWEDDKILVSEIARLDWAYYRLYAVRALPPLVEGDLGKRLYLQPSISLFSMRGEFFAFRSALLSQEIEYWIEHPFPSIEMFSEKKYFALYLENMAPRYEEIPKEAYQILKRFQKGSTLEEALEGISSLEVGRWFQKWAKRGWISARAAAFLQGGAIQRSPQLS